LTRLLAKVFLSLVLLALLAFCVFGFAATFEPMEPSTQIVGRLIYAVLAAAAAGGLMLVVRRAKEGK